VPTIAPTDDWQTVIDANPAGSTYDVLAGTHTGVLDVRPKSGDTFLGHVDSAGDPTSILDGAWALATPAFRADADVVDVGFRDLQVQRYRMDDLQAGTGVNMKNVTDTALRWSFDNIVFTTMIGRALNTGGGTHVKGCTFRKCYMGGGGVGDDVIVERSDWRGLNDPDADLETY